MGQSIRRLLIDQGRGEDNAGTGREQGRRGAGQPNRGVDVGLGGLSQILRGEVRDIAEPGSVSGVVDQDIETSHQLGGLVHELPAKGLIAEIARDRVDARVGGRLDDVDHVVCIRLFGWEVVDNNVGSFSCESNRYGPSNSRVAAGDQCPSASEPSSSDIAGFAAVKRCVELAL